MVETMVGVMIGLIVVLVVYNLFAVAEGYKRSTVGAADAQVTGLVGHFITSLEAANGGNGFASAYNDLINCSTTEAGAAYNATNTLKPMSVLVTPGALATDSDSFVSWQSSSPHVVWPVAVRLPSPLPGAEIVVQSPNGFSTPGKASLPTVAAPFWAVMIANDGTGRCGLIQITNSTASDDVTGEVTLTQGTPATSIDYSGVAINDTGTGAFLLNLGRVNPTGGGASRVRYDIANGQLRATNSMYADGCANAGAVPNPVAQNVVWMKVQYGIDTDPLNANGTLNGSVDCWSPADNTCAVGGFGWAPDTVITAGNAGGPPAEFLKRIAAVRVGIVVRSDEPDMRNPSLFRPSVTTIDGVTGTRPPEYLFNCAANTDAGCPGRVLIPAGATPPSILLDGNRYRTYEAVIPLRNSIFAATLPP